MMKMMRGLGMRGAMRRGVRCMATASAWGGLGIGMKSKMSFSARRCSIVTPTTRANSRLQAGTNNGVGKRGLLTRSYAQGSTDRPLINLTIPEHFHEVVMDRQDDLAVISTTTSPHLRPEKGPFGATFGIDERRLTYVELSWLSQGMSLTLSDRGVKKGHRVAVSLGNGWEFAVATYAIWSLGAILVPLNPSYNAPQVIAALNHLDTAHLIIGAETNLPFKPPRENITLLKELVPTLTSRKDLRSPAVPSLKNLFLVDNSDGRIDTSTLKATIPFSSLFDCSVLRMVYTPPTSFSPDDIINIQFTSGTTSAPKAAALTHRSILNNGFQIGSRMGLTRQDVIVCPPPLFHCFGSILGYMATMTHGSTIVFPSPAFDPVATLLAVQEEKATGLYGVPTMFTSYLELLSSGKISREGFQHLRTGIVAGSSIPSHLMSRLTKELDLDGITICYGMTETSPVSFMTYPDDPLEKKLHTVGRLLPHLEAKIVAPSSSPTSTSNSNPDSNTDDEILPIGTKGELLISGYNVMKSYWNAPERTKEVLQSDGDGKIWMRTGDEASMDPEGYVTITGRIKDLIIRGGENIHPLEIEDCILGLDGVSAVSVVGLPDERYGEVVAAFIIPKAGWKTGVDDFGGHVGGAEGAEGAEGFLDKEYVTRLVGERLSGHLVPKYVFWVTDFPKTVSGKVQKFQLREVGERGLRGREEKKGDMGRWVRDLGVEGIFRGVERSVNKIDG